MVAVQKPVAFHSHKLSSVERNYIVGEQELLAVVLALKQWRCYLEGAKGGVTVVTDHKPNTFLDKLDYLLLTLLWAGLRTLLTELVIP